MKKSRNHISREQIRIALDRFYAQGGQIRVLPPQQIEADSNYHISQKLEEFELFDKTTLLPTDLDNALRNSLFTNPLMDPQDKL